MEVERRSVKGETELMGMKVWRMLMLGTLWLICCLFQFFNSWKLLALSCLCDDTACFNMKLISFFASDLYIELNHGIYVTSLFIDIESRKQVLFQYNGLESVTHLYPAVIWI